MPLSRDRPDRLEAMIARIRACVVAIERDIAAAKNPLAPPK
jgi:hypothetical protein